MSHLQELQLNIFFQVRKPQTTPEGESALTKSGHRLGVKQAVARATSMCVSTDVDISRSQSVHPLIRSHENGSLNKQNVLEVRGNENS